MSRKDTIPPPNAGEPISARYLAQEHRRVNRIAPKVLPPLFLQDGGGGCAIGIRLPGMIVAATTSDVSGATYSGTAVTSFGEGTAALHETDGTTAAPNADKEVDVKQLGRTSIPSGTTVLLYPLYGEAVGLFVLGKICP